MESILSLKPVEMTINGNLPLEGFGRFAFGIPRSDSIDGNGFRREEIQKKEAIAEEKPVYAPSPSSISLEGLLAPIGIGKLEQISLNPKINAQKNALPLVIPALYTSTVSAASGMFSYLAPIVARIGTSSTQNLYVAAQRTAKIQDDAVSLHPVSVQESAHYETTLLQMVLPDEISYSRTNLVPAALPGIIPLGFVNYSAAYVSNYQPAQRNYSVNLQTTTQPKIVSSALPTQYSIKIDTATIVSSSYTEILQPTNSFYETKKVQMQQTAKEPTPKAVTYTSTLPSGKYRAIAKQETTAIQPQSQSKLEEILEVKPSHTAEFHLQHQTIPVKYEKPVPETKQYGKNLQNEDTAAKTNSKAPSNKYAAIPVFSYSAPFVPTTTTPASSINYTTRNIASKPLEIRLTETKIPKIAGFSIERASKSAYSRAQKYSKPAAKRKNSRYSTKYVKPTPKYDSKEEKPDIQKTYAAKPEEIAKPEPEKQPDAKEAPYKKDEPSAISYAGAAIAGLGAVGISGAASAIASLFGKKNTPQTTSLQNPEPQSIDDTLSPVAGILHQEQTFTPEFQQEISGLAKRLNDLGYGNVSISIRNNTTGEYYGIDDKNPKPAPSLNKVAIAFAAQYMMQNGLLDPNKKIEFDPEADKELILEREKQDYQILNEKQSFGHDELRQLMIRQSVNTITNLYLKFIGDGDVWEGINRVTDTLEKLGLGNIKIVSPYNKIFEYEKNTATTEAAERLAGYIIQGKHLGQEYMKPIKDDMTNEHHMKLYRDMLPGIETMTKITTYKHGTGFIARMGDYSVSLLASDSNAELYSNRATSAGLIKRFASPILNETTREFGALFKMLGHHFFKLDYAKSAEKAA